MRALIYARQSVGNKKSIDDQIEECGADVRALGWKLVDKRHDGSSASRLARKARADWARVLAMLEAGDFDVLVLWESSRGDRDAEAWLGLLRRCRERGVLIRIVNDEYTYDVRITRDWEHLANQGIKNAVYSEEVRDRALKGIRGAIRRGHPPMGPAPYGYRREYHPENGAVQQVPQNAHAFVVQEIFERVAKAEPLRAICRDLDTRGVPTPNGAAAWRPYSLRQMCRNTAYIAQRAGQPGNWPPLVKEAVFYAAVRVLEEPKRQKHNHYSRPGRQEHLLSYLATCAKEGCGGPARALAGSYECAVKQCFKVKEAEADELVRDLAIGRLSMPDLYQRLRSGSATAGKIVRDAENEIATLTARLGEWRSSAAKGKTSPDTMAVIEEEIARDVLAAERRRDAAALPSALEGWPGPEADVRARWAAATVQARRGVLRALLVVRFVSAGGRKGVPMHERVDTDWLENSLPSS